MNPTPASLSESILSGKGTFPVKRLSVVVMIFWAILANGMTITKTSCRFDDVAEWKSWIPIFGLVLESHQRGDSQTAYQILVSGMWNPGKVISDQLVNVAYAGPPPAKANGVSFLRAEAGYAIYEIGSGNYPLTARSAQ